jgi:hypothetical protein
MDRAIVDSVYGHVDLFHEIVFRKIIPLNSKILGHHIFTKAPLNFSKIIF